MVFGGNGLLAKKLAAKNIQTLAIPTLQRDISLLKDIGTFFVLLRIFKSERPNIIHLNSSKAAALGALAARIAGIRRIIFTVHGWPFNEKRGRLWRSCTWLVSYLTALLSTEVIVITSLDFKQAKAMPLVSEKTHLIPNGITMPEFLSREEAREKLLLPQNALVIGSLGELTQNKGYPELVTVASKLLQEGQDFLLAIIGEGEARATISDQILKNPVLNGRVILLGFQEDARAYLNAFDLFVLNSRKEGLPYVLLEAGAAGLPVAATAVGGILDIIENEKTGLLAPPHTMEGALLKLLTDKEARNKFGSALKAEVKKRFSFTKMLTDTLALYR